MLSAPPYVKRQRAAACGQPYVKKCFASPQTMRTARKCGSFESRWPNSRRAPSLRHGQGRGVPPRRATRGREQIGARCAVVVQVDEFLHLSTTIVAPTSTSARPATFRPVITVDGEDTRVLVEQRTVVDPQRLVRSAGRLEAAELLAVDEALALILGV